MIDVGTLVMKVEADTKKFTTGIGKVTDTLGRVAKTTAIATAAIAGATVVAGAKFVAMGADAEEMRNKYDVVFKGMTDTVDDWTENYSDAVGRSKFDIQESVANLADLQQGLGMTAEESFELSKKVVTLGTDLASFNNVNDDVAIEAVSKAMLGEAESAKQLGLLLNVERVKDFAEAQGLVYNELTDAAKANLVYELAVTQSQNALGDAERSAGSFTNQMKELKSNLKDTATEIGMQMIPIATKLVTKFNDNVAPVISKVASRAVDLASDFGTKMQPAFEKMQEWWDNNGEAVKGKVKIIFEKIGEFAGNVVTFYNEHLVPVFDTLKKWWDDNKETLITAAGELFDGIVTAATKVWDYFEKTLLPILTGVATYITTNYPLIKDVVDAAFKGIIKVAKSLGKLFDETLMPILEDIGEEFDTNLPNAADDTVTAIELISGAISFLIEMVGTAIGELEKLHKLLKLPQDISNALSDLVGGSNPTDDFAIEKFNEIDAIRKNEERNDLNNSTPDYINNSILTDPSISRPMSNNTNNAPVTININDAKVLNGRDVDILGNQIIKQLKLAGIKVN